MLKELPLTPTPDSINNRSGASVLFSEIGGRAVIYLLKYLYNLGFGKFGSRYRISSAKPRSVNRLIRLIFCFGGPPNVAGVDAKLVAARMGGFGPRKRSISVGHLAYEDVCACVFSLKVDRPIPVGRSGVGPANAVGGCGRHRSLYKLEGLAVGCSALERVTMLARSVRMLSAPFTRKSALLAPAHIANFVNVFHTENVTQTGHCVYFKGPK